VDLFPQNDELCVIRTHDDDFHRCISRRSDVVISRALIDSRIEPGDVNDGEIDPVRTELGERILKAEVII